MKPSHVPFGLEVLCVGIAVSMALVAGCSEPAEGVSGVLEAPRYNVSADRGGRIVEVLVDEGDPVEADDVLVRLECTGPTLQLDDARAALATARAQHTLVRSGPRSAELDAAEAAVDAAREQERLARNGATRNELAQIDAAIAATDARIHLAERTVERLTRLDDAGATTGAERDAAQAELDAARADRERLSAQRAEAGRGARSEQRAILASQTARAEAQLRGLQDGARDEEVAVAATAVDRAEVAVRAAEAAVDDCVVRAPRAGVVSIVDYEVGETIGPGVPLVAIETGDAVDVRSWAPQPWLVDLVVGSTVHVRVDGLDGPPLAAEVVRIHDDAEFTPGNVQTPDDRVLLVYRLDLRIVDAPPFALRSGMTVTVHRDSSTPAGGHE